MKRVLENLDRRARDFQKHPLFAFLRDPDIDVRQRLAFVPQMSHFVMTFADLYSLVLRVEPAKDRFQELVNAHTYEDGGHWKWYLSDLEKLGNAAMPFSDALRFVWGESTTRMRLLSYHMCRLGFGADSIRKLVLVQCIEASGSIMLGSAEVAGREFAESTGRKLVYFGPHHFETESNHTLEKDDVAESLDATALDDALAASLSALVDECFTLFTACVDEILAFAQSAAPRRATATEISAHVIA